MRNTFVQTLCELAEQDERIWLLCGDLGYSLLEGFARRFPERFVNVGIAEQNMVGIATGLSSCGKIVVIYSIANFPTLRCLEQIRNDICFHQANVKIVTVGGGFVYGTQGVTHQVLEDLAIMRALPQMTVIAPADAVETKVLTKVMMNLKGPSYLRLGRGGEAVLHSSDPLVNLGQMIPVKSGSEVLIISTGAILANVLEAAHQAQHKGHSPEVWSCPWLKPMDTKAIIQAAQEYRVIITVEEAQMSGGLGGAVAEIVSGLPSTRAVLRRLGVADCYLQEAYTQAAARAKVGLDVSSILQVIQESYAAKTKA